MWKNELSSFIKYVSPKNLVVQCNDKRGNAFVDEVMTLMQETYPEINCLVGYPTACCASVENALHFERPCLLIIDNYCPNAADVKDIPVCFLSSRDAQASNGVIASLTTLLSPLAQDTTVTILHEKMHKDDVTKGMELSVANTKAICTTDSAYITDLAANLSIDIMILVAWCGTSVNVETAESLLRDFSSLPKYVQLVLSSAFLRSRAKSVHFVITMDGASKCSELTLSHEAFEDVTVRYFASSLAGKRVAFCLAPVHASTIALICADTSKTTLERVNDLRKDLSRIQEVSCDICYFGQKLDESKLGNFGAAYELFVYVSSCPIMCTPWMNTNFAKVAAHTIPVVTLFEYLFNHSDRTFEYDYEVLPDIVDKMWRDMMLTQTNR